MAATTLYQLEGGPIEKGAYASLYDKTFDDIVKKQEEEPKEGESLFGTIDTRLNEWKRGEVSDRLDIPLINSDSDKIPLVSPVEGFPKTFTPRQRRSGFIVTREAIEKQRFDQINAMLTGLPASNTALIEIAIAAFFAGTFATETGGDGSFVFATDHKLEDPKFGTWSNKAASAGGVTTASLNDAWTSLHGRVNAKGRPNPSNPKTLVYHYTKNEAVMKVLGSDQYPQNSLNAVIPKFIKAVDPMPMHWLTSEDQWFVRGERDTRDPGFKIVYNARPTYMAFDDSMNPDLIMGKRSRISFAVGSIHSRAWYGNEGA